MNNSTEKTDGNDPAINGHGEGVRE